MSEQAPSAQSRVLWLSTCAFTLMFNVWLMLGVLGISVRRELDLTDGQLEWLIAVAILSGAIFRLNFGIWTDTYGGRKVMGLLLLLAAVPTYLFSHASSFEELLACAALFGLAGNSFSVGIAWNSAWFPKEAQGRALGVFGAGNVGAAGTKMLAAFVPGILTAIPAAGYWGGWIPGGWRFVPALYAALLVLMSVAVFAFSPGPDRMPGRGRSLRQALVPLRHQRVWRFGLYYVVVFGAYVALSGWLPKYYIDTYDASLGTAAMLTALFIFPASLLRPLGGWMADRWGARPVTYGVFIVMTGTLMLLAMPSGHFIADAHPGVPPLTLTYKLGIGPFTALMLVLGCAMGIGKASVFKYVPDYFPRDVGAAGGVVGALGALGGFILPPAFGWLARSSGVPQLAFLALLGLTLWSLGWLHLTVVRSRSSEARVPRIAEAEYIAPGGDV